MPINTIAKWIAKIIANESRSVILLSPVLRHICDTTRKSDEVVKKEIHERFFSSSLWFNWAFTIFFLYYFADLYYFAKKKWKSNWSTNAAHLPFLMPHISLSSIIHPWRGSQISFPILLSWRTHIFSSFLALVISFISHNIQYALEFFFLITAIFFYFLQFATAISVVYSNSFVVRKQQR